MSQDGSWQDVRARAGLNEANVAQHRERMEAERERSGPDGAAGDGYDVERAQHERLEELEQHARNLSTVIAALVQLHGEETAPGLHRLALTEEQLASAMDGTLSTFMDPNSGALLIRFRPLL